MDLDDAVLPEEYVDSVMQLDDAVLPEEYVDSVMQEFAYDPIKLPYEEDFSQVLYNRRTLETIWDTKHDAINPYTRQPFHIHNAIPQTELKQQMREYILNNRSVTLSLGLEVIPDYTQILNETEMKQLMNELVAAGNLCEQFLKKKKKRRHHRNRKPDEKELEQWKALCKKLNLVRLYCQYRAENRMVFSSISGYKYLFQVINIQRLYSCPEYSSSPCDDAEEVSKELARIVDVMGGLKQQDLLMAPNGSVIAFVWILFSMDGREYLKIRRMVLRIYRGMIEDCIVYLLSSEAFDPVRQIVVFAIDVLSGWENPSDIVNEDLYNGMAILTAAWKSINVGLFDCSHCMTTLCVIVTMCISRLQEWHDAFTAHQAHDDHPDAMPTAHDDFDDDHPDAMSTGHDDFDNEEMEQNIHLLSTALEQGLFLIHSLLTSSYSEEEPYRYAASRETLRSMDIVKQIVRMVKFIVADSKVFLSDHLLFGLKITELVHEDQFLFGLNITELVHEEEGNHNNSGMIFKSQLVRALEDFLESKYVDEYGIEIKQLVRYIVCASPRHRQFLL